MFIGSSGTFRQQAMVCSKGFLSKFSSFQIPLKHQKAMVYSKGFLSKLGHFEIFHSRVCTCSLGPLEHFVNKLWSAVRGFCQHLALTCLISNN